MFRGNYASRVDSKGQLKLPTDFKHEIERNYDNHFYVTYIHGNGIEIYPLREWKRMEERILALQDSQPVLTKKILDIAAYFGEVTSMDTQGRLRLPERLLKKAGITSKVAVIGKLILIEVSSWETFEPEVAKQLREDLDSQD